jgi:putative Ca2+/H+ antiporter (TMEM165/GDT1 family)
MVEILMKVLMGIFESPTAMSVIAGVLVWLLRAILKDRWEKMESTLEAAVGAAASLVDDIAKKTDTKVDDQVALFLKAFKDYLAAHGHEPSPAQLAKAEAVFKAMKGHS